MSRSALAALFVLALATPANASTTHLWSGEGTAADSVGGANGTLNGDAGFAAGAVGQGFSFDGSGDYADFGTTAGNFGTADYSVSFWFRADHTDRQEGMLGKRPFCAHASMWDIRLKPLNDPVSIVGELDGSTSGTNYNTLLSTLEVADGAFHHLSIVRSGPTATLYIDGVEADTETTAGTTNMVNSAALWAGRSACTGSSDGTQYFTGVLDEIRFIDEADPTAYDFDGFFAPVDNGVVNLVTAGRAIPVKFSLGGDQGLAVFRNGYPKSQTSQCDPGEETDGIEETVTAGSSSLSYDPLTDQYTYVWKTDKAWANSCRQLVLAFADGSVRRATFQLKK